jgi:hypothetical protein
MRTQMHFSKFCGQLLIQTWSPSYEKTVIQSAWQGSAPQIWRQQSRLLQIQDGASSQQQDQMGTVAIRPDTALSSSAMAMMFFATCRLEGDSTCRWCPLLAQSRHDGLRRTRPLSGAKRTLPFARIRFRGRYWGQSGHAVLHCICPLLTQSGHLFCAVRFWDEADTPCTRLAIASSVAGFFIRVSVVSGQKVKANLLANKAYFSLCREEHISGSRVGLMYQKAQWV